MRKLTSEELKSITVGTEYLSEENGCVSFHRFTKEQEELYREKKNNLYSKVFSGSGIKLRFETDSESLFMRIIVNKASSRSYFSLSVYSDGEYIGKISNFDKTKLNNENLKSEYLLGEFSENFELKKGKKTITIYMPWSVSVSIKEFLIDYGASLIPKKYDKRILIFGDSITQGYDATEPENTYASRICELLNAEGINKAIGGECFFPELAEMNEDFVPEYITVAYGTNDWYKTNRACFEKNSKEFFISLRKKYPTAIIYAISPIWRKESEEKLNGWNFRDVACHIKEIACEVENIIFIDGFDFVPHESKYFADLRLHPNDDGFLYFWENLYAKAWSKMKHNGDHIS